MSASIRFGGWALAALLAGCGAAMTFGTAEDEAPAARVTVGSARAPALHFNAIASKGNALRYHAQADGFSVTLDAASTELSLGNRGSFSLGRATLQRGATALASDGASRQSEEGALEFGSNVTERWMGASDSLEQSWRFPSRPAGSGDVTVRVPFSGLAFEGSDDSGLSFGAAGEGRVRYSHATWVDANGVRSAIPVAVEGSELVMTLASSLVDASAYPAVLDPTVTPDVSFDAPVFGPASSGQTFPSVARLGAGYVAAWTDLRSGQPEIFATRVSAAGAPTDTMGIPVSVGSQSALASDGNTAVVVFIRGGALFGSTINDAGAVSAPVQLAQNPIAALEAPAIAYNGSSYLVTYENGEGRAAAVRLNNAGALVGQPFVIDAVGAGGQFGPTVAGATTSGNFLVTWEVGGEVRAARVSGGGAVLDSPSRLVSTLGGARTTSVASNGNDFLIAWESTRAGQAEPDIAVARVSGAGALLDATPVYITTGNQGHRSPATIWNGTQYLTTWNEAVVGSGFEVFTARISSAGALLGTEEISRPVAAGYNYQPALAPNGGTTLVVWQHNGGPTEDDIHATRVGVNGELLGSTDAILSLGANGQRRPATARNGDGFLLAWEDRRGIDYGILYSRMNASGAAGGTTVTVDSSNSLKERVTAASVDGSTLIVWREYLGAGFEIRGVRVAASGALEGSPVTYAASTEGVDYPSLVASGNGYVLVYAENSGTQRLVRARRIAASGAAQGTASTVATATSLSEQFAVGSTGATSLVAFSGTVGGTEALYAVRLNEALTAQGAAFAVSSVANGLEPRTPAAACVATGCLVSWAQRDSTYVERVRARTVGLDGALGEDVLVASERSVQPALSADDWGYWLTWARFTGERTDVVGRRATQSGRLLDSTPLVIAADPIEEREPSVAAIGGGRAVSAYVISDVELGAPRVRARVLGSAAPTGGGNFSLTTLEDVPVVLPFNGTDADGDALTYRLVTQPTLGTVSGDGMNPTYTPNLDVFGTESFTYVITDGQSVSAPATVTIVITPVNDGPRPQPLTLQTQEETPVTFTVTAIDPEGDAIAGFAIHSQPANGRVTGTGPEFTYTPNADFFGTDTFTLTASDVLGAVSEPTTMTVNVINVNDPPRALTKTIVVYGVATEIELPAEDPDGDALTFNVLSGPDQGTLTGSGPRFTYTPPEGFRGTTTVTFTVSDAEFTSDVGTLTLQVEEPDALTGGGKSGCGCGAANGVSGLAVWALALGALVARRRRGAVKSL